MKRVLFAMATTLAFALSSTGASAATLTLSAAPLNTYQQTTNSPCLIGENSCNNPAGFERTLLPNANSFDVYSPTYTVGQLRTLVGNDFIVGLDVNQTNIAQQLSLFQILIDGLVIDEYVAPADPGYTMVPAFANGNGYADYLFQNFTGFAGLAAASTVQFRAAMPLVNDGKEQFFLINTGDAPCAPPDPACSDPEPDPDPVPEPTTLALLGLGLFGAGYVRRFRQ